MHLCFTKNVIKQIMIKQIILNTHLPTKEFVSEGETTINTVEIFVIYLVIHSKVIEY